MIVIEAMFPLLITQVLDLAVVIQQIPAPTFAEGRRAEFIYQRFLAEGLSAVSKDADCNVYACLPGTGNALPLVISAHLDTVFPETTDLAVTRSTEEIAGPGIGDNSLGLAGLFGLVWSLRLRGRSLPGDIWLVANVGEEGLGDLNGMRAVVDRFGDQVLAYLVLEGMALGHIYNRGLGVRRYRITVQTTGGHSWVDFGRPSAVHELAAIITSLVALPIPSQPRTTLNVGTINGGTSINTIAATASLELDLRSEDIHTLHGLSAQVENLAANASRSGVEVVAEVIGDRPPGEISSDHRLVRLARQCLEAQGIQSHLHIGSTDANVPLSRDLPAVCLGLTTGSGAHTRSEFIRTRPLAQGLAQLVALVEQLYA
jgi:acetylornithine deacetylase/succinyl-diaminopimelate desuccinylase-like protein